MIVFEGTLQVHYGQAYVFGAEAADTGELEAFFQGQKNGLLGAALPGALFLMTGLHTGPVQLRVEVVETEPPIDDSWEECVEATFEPDRTSVLVDWDGNAVFEIPLGGEIHRVRYCAKGMDEAHEVDNILEGEALIDAYLLSFWPAPADEDRIVKQTSATAEYQHRWAQEL